MERQTLAATVPAVTVKYITGKGEGETRTANGAKWKIVKATRNKRNRDNDSFRHPTSLKAEMRSAVVPPDLTRELKRGSSITTAPLHKQHSTVKTEDEAKVAVRGSDMYALTSQPQQDAKVSRALNPDHRFDYQSTTNPAPEPQSDGRTGLPDDCGGAADEKRHDNDEVEQAHHSGLPPGPPPTRAQLARFTGTYEVRTNIINDWDDYEGYQPTITIAVYRGELWGNYDFGMFDGGFCFTRSSWTETGGVANVCWRGRENGEGEVSWDDVLQRGQIAVDEDGNISGHFKYLCENILTIQGVRTGPAPRGRGRVLRAAWIDFAEEAIDAEEAQIARGAMWLP